MLSGQSGLIRLGVDTQAGGKPVGFELHVTLTAAEAGT